MPNDPQQSNTPEITDDTDKPVTTPIEPTITPGDQAAAAVDLDKPAPESVSVGPSADTTPVTSSFDPAATAQPHEPRPWLQPQQERKGPSKKLIISLVALIAVIIVVASGWAAYALWYQNPEKVVADAMVNSLNARTLSFNGTISGSSSGDDKSSDYSVAFDGKGGLKEGASGSMTISWKPTSGSTLKVPVEGISLPNGDSYLKVSNLQQAADSYLKAYEGLGTSDAASSLAIIDQIIQKIDGKWLKFSASSIRQYSPQTADEYDCTQKVMTKLADNKQQLKEIGDVYQRNRVLNITQSLGMKGGDMGYAIDVDKKAAKSFTEDMKNTQFYKDLKACYKNGSDPLADNGDGSSSPSDESDSYTTRIEVWISQWSHQLSKVHAEISNSSDGSVYKNIVDMKTTFDAPVTISAPAKSTPFEDAFPDLANMFSSGFDEAAGTSATKA